MKVAFVNFTGGGMSGGYKKYLQKVLPLIQKHPDIEEPLCVYVPTQQNKVLNVSGIPILSWPEDDARKNFFSLKNQISKMAVDVVFIPNARYIKFKGIPTAVMIQNMEPLSVPFNGNPIKESIKNLARAYFARKACTAADRILAISKYVKEFLVTRLGIENNRIGIVYHGVEFPNDKLNTEIPERLKEIKSSSFVFTAGSIRPARGLEDLIKAFSFIKKNLLDLKLTIAGDVDIGMERYKAKLEKLIKKFGLDSAVFWAGSLTEREMSWCYLNSKAFVMTSRVEACPNIALEAMAHGCVCISTKTPPMPEIFKDVALYYPPRDVKILANSIYTVILNNYQWKIERSQISKKRAEQFGWDICANRTVQELKKTVELYNQ